MILDLHLEKCSVATNEALLGSSSVLPIGTTTAQDLSYFRTCCSTIFGRIASHRSERGTSLPTYSSHPEHLQLLTARSCTTFVYSHTLRIRMPVCRIYSVKQSSIMTGMGIERDRRVYELVGSYSGRWCMAVSHRSRANLLSHNGCRLHFHP